MKMISKSTILAALFAAIAAVSTPCIAQSSTQSNDTKWIAQPTHSGKGLSTPVLHEGRPGEVGFSAKKLLALDAIIQGAIKDSATPGAVLLVARDGVIVYQKAFGRFTYSPHSEKVTVNTIYDLASVTKVAATTISIMKLYDEGKIGLNDPIAKYFPRFAENGKGKVTIKNLLMHDGGFPPDRPFYRMCHTPEEVFDSLYATKLVYKTGIDTMVYSDLDFITLGRLVEKVTGMPLDKYVKEIFYEPLRMKSTTYNPPKQWLNRIAPTEYDSTLGGYIHGVVHDRNARALGGVSGHAGLFSTAHDLAVLMQMILNGGTYDSKRFFNKETVELFTKRQVNNYCLGFDNALSPYGRSALAGAFGPNAFGHTGFTGTSVYVYPEKKIIAVLLTNRVCPTRKNEKILPLRRAVHRAIVEALINRVNNDASSERK